MGYLDDKLNSYLSFRPGNTGNINKVAAQGQTSTKTTGQPAAAETSAEEVPNFDEMSDLQVKAEMNKALGFIITEQPKGEVDFAKIDKQFAQNPLAFAAKHTTPEVRTNTASAVADFEASVALSTLPQERQEQILTGFSQRNENPNAFTDSFLDLFSVKVS